MADEPEVAPERVDFSTHILSLASSALISLGKMPAPGGETIETDLDAAKHLIDVLGVLQDKTKGNLTATEQNFLQNALYELRMAYVEVTNALARPPQQATGTNPIKR